MGAVFKRELRAYFTSPIGYFVMIIYGVLYGFLFSRLFRSGSPAINVLFSYSFTVTLFIIPVITMRLFSEERRQKTDQALFTAPVGLTSIVFGKFFAAWAMFGLTQLITVVFELIFAFNVSVDMIGYICYLIGAAGVSASLIAVGMFISSLTDSQILAAVGSIAVSVMLAMMDTFAQLTSVRWLVSAANWLSFSSRFDTFLSGVLDYANVAYFISFAAVFIFLTVRIQEKRRWS